VHGHDFYEYKELESIDVSSGKLQRERANSMLGKRDLRRIYKLIEERELLEVIEEEETKQKTLKEKTKDMLKGIFFANSYFESLFPSIKE
jgi:hypothetical protein